MHIPEGSFEVVVEMLKHGPSGMEGDELLSEAVLLAKSMDIVREEVCKAAGIPPAEADSKFVFYACNDKSSWHVQTCSPFFNTVAVGDRSIIRDVERAARANAEQAPSAAMFAGVSWDDDKTSVVVVRRAVVKFAVEKLLWSEGSVPRRLLARARRANIEGLPEDIPFGTHLSDITVAMLVLGAACTHCGKTAGDAGAALKKCARCRIAEYCCRACQLEDWPEHKGTCTRGGGEPTGQLATVSRDDFLQLIQL